MRFRDMATACTRECREDRKGNDVKSLQLADNISINGKDMTASARINTDAIDYQRGVILASGVGIENYRNNPIVLFEHGLSSIAYPIATSENPDTGELAVDRQDFHIDATSWFSQRLEEAYQVFALIDEGIIRATSIQVVPYKKAYYTDQDGERYEVTEESDMVEWSWCAMGVNPEALRRSMVDPSSERIKEALALQCDGAEAVLKRGSLGGSRLLAPIRKSLKALVPKANATSPGWDNTEKRMALRHLTAYEVRSLSGRSLAKAMKSLYDFDAPTRRRLKSIHAEMAAGDEDELERIEESAPEAKSMDKGEEDAYIMGEAQGRPQAKCLACGDDAHVPEGDETEMKSMDAEEEDRPLCPECAENEAKALADVMEDEDITEEKSCGMAKSYEEEDLTDEKMLGEAYSMHEDEEEGEVEAKSMEMDEEEVEHHSDHEAKSLDHDGEELADEASMMEAEETERKTLGAEVTEDLYDAIKLLYDHFSNEMKSVEKESVVDGVSEELEAIRTSLSSLEGMYGENYPENKSLDDRAEPDTDSEFANQMKAMIASNRRSGYQVLGLAGRIDRIVSDSRIPSAHRKSLRGLSKELKRVRSEAKSFSGNGGEVVPRAQYDALVRKFRDLEKSTHTLLDSVSEKIFPAS